MVTYPREFFSYKVSAMTFTPDAGTVVVVHSGGRAASVSGVYEPGFSLSVEVSPITDEERIGWKAWLATLGGGAKPFLAYDLRQSVPFAYRDQLPLVAGQPWTGLCTLSAAPTIKTAQLAGLPAGLKLTAGDYIGFEQGVGAARKYAASLLDDDVTASAQGEASVSFSPGIPAGLFTTGATVNFVRVKMKFVIPQTATIIGSSVDAPSFSFDALQIF